MNIARISTGLQVHLVIMAYATIHDLCTTQNKHVLIWHLKSLKKNYISLCRLKSVEINSLTKISS